MMSKSKWRNIPTPADSKLSTNIPSQKLPYEEGNFIFIFSELDQDHRKYTCRGQQGVFFSSLLDNLKRLSNTLIEVVKKQRDNSFQFHPIDWESAGHPEGFSHLDEQKYGGLPPYQFAVGEPRKKGRVYGFLNGPCFYIVWIDPKHQQYRQRK